MKDGIHIHTRLKKGVKLPCKNNEVLRLDLDKPSLKIRQFYEIGVRLLNDYGDEVLGGNHGLYDFYVFRINGACDQLPSLIPRPIEKLAHGLPFFLCDTQDFLQGCQPHLNLVQPINPDGLDPLFSNIGQYFFLGNFLFNHLLDFVGHRNQFKNTKASPKSRQPALTTSHPPIGLCEGKTHFFYFFKIRDDFLTTTVTYPTNQTLCEESLQRAPNKEGFHPQICETRNGPNRRVGMKCGKNEMPCDRRSHGDIRGLPIANLTDHDDVGILAQN